MIDEELIQLIKTNKEKGFRAMLKHYQKPLYFFIRKVIYSHDDANDISQNVWIKVYKNLDGFNGDAKFSTWLYRIAYNESINFLKKEAKKLNVSIDEVGELKAQTLQEDVLFTGDEIQLLLQKAVSKLPEKQRTVFVMKYFEEKKYDEISKIIGTSVGALKASYHHAVKKISTDIKLIKNH